MRLSAKAIDEFKQLYKEKYGEELTDLVASEAANRLVRMIEIVYKPILKVDEVKCNQLKKEQEAIPEDQKRDFVKHLVEDAKVTEWKLKNNPPKHKKERM
ncbi:MAG: hypothetical protein A3J67_03045 [Parcubacteria group bacterium RIFCSPHIGHO2_02_FULL_48_10b]|nr:MAG: hypothetical protein A3J67_03045 [Parcubacteria group bacterium RIFCSPHIGHO2_02_FULL_48_10b]